MATPRSACCCTPTATASRTSSSSMHASRRRIWCAACWTWYWRRAAEIGRGPVLAESALRALERTGALCIEDAQRAGDPDLRIVVVEGDAENPPSVDWRMLRRGREREYTKLEWMQRYAYTRGCRR